MSNKVWKRRVEGASKAMQEGREARKAGEPRVSPYAGIALLQALSGPWLAGWDAMDSILSR
jgi:hypothetical protein